MRRVDLTRARVALDGLDRLARVHPELVDVTARGPNNRAGWADVLTTLEDYSVTRYADKHVPVRIPEALLERAEALRPALASVPELAAMGTVSRAAVIRLAIVRGLASLEAEHAARLT